MKIYAASHLLPISAPPVPGGALAVENGRIAAVGTLSELSAAYSAPVAEFPACAIIPGLVNAHSHLELTHFPSWKIRKGIDYVPRTYVDWIIQVIKIRRSLTRRELELSVLEGMRISLESGTTAVGEITTDSRLLPLYRQSSLSGRVYLEAVGHDPVRCAEFLSSLDERLSELAGGNPVSGISPHAPHTLSGAFFRDVARIAELRCLPMAVHLSESREELDFLFDTTGPIAEKLYPFVGWERYLPPPMRTDPARYLDGLGILKPGTMAIHCVHLTPAEAEILRSRGVGVVLCPRSNEKLDVGSAPVHLLKKLGIPLALGTDSLASNDSLSLFDEMIFLLERFPQHVSPADALRMATLSAASVIGREGEIGSISKGKRADFLILSLPDSRSGDDIHDRILRDGRLQEVYVSGSPLGVETS